MASVLCGVSLLIHRGIIYILEVRIEAILVRIGVRMRKLGDRHIAIPTSKSRTEIDTEKERVNKEILSCQV